MARWPIWMVLLALSTANPQTAEKLLSPNKEYELDSAHTRKLLGSSVVTSVSVIMDHGNGTKTYITDGGGMNPSESTSGQLGRPPQAVGSPGALLSPDRYEFYTFGKEGELVKKLMTLDQIQSLIAAANGEDDDDLSDQPVYYNQPLVEAGDSEGVNKVLESVHNVLKGELEAAAAAGQHSAEVSPLISDQPWTILLPGLLNNDMDLKEPLQPSTKKRPPPSTTTRKPSTTTVTTPAATTRFPPRRTTTYATPSTTQQHHATVISSSYKNPPNRFTFTTRVPPLPVVNQEEQQVASPSILSPQYSSNVAPTLKPVTAGISSTYKYSAHYTTPYPIPVKNTNKPQQQSGGVPIKKPTGITKEPTKSTTPVVTTTFSPTTTTSQPALSQTTQSKTTSSTTKRITTGPPITTYKASTLSPLPTLSNIKNTIINNNYVQRNSTHQQYKPTTYKPAPTGRPQPVKYTEYPPKPPSGIPTIVHYLPMNSISPSHAPVHSMTTPGSTGSKLAEDSKVETEIASTSPATTTSTTASATTTTTTSTAQSSSTTAQQKTTPEITVEIMSSSYPSVASVTTKNHYTVINAMKPPSTVIASSPPSTTPQSASTYETLKAGTNAIAAQLMAEPSTMPMQTLLDQDTGDTVSVVTVLEDSTKPIEIMTTAGKVPIVTSDSLVTKLTTTEKDEGYTVYVRPSSEMLQISTRPTTMQPSSVLYKNNYNNRPTNSRPASAVYKSTTTTAAPPPRRGSVSYTPLPEVYKTTPSTVSSRQPTRTTTYNTLSQSSVTTVRPSAATTLQRATSTSSTTSKPTTTTSTPTTTTSTTSKPIITTSKPTTTTLNNTLEQIPLKLHENIKESSRPTVADFPSTQTTESFSSTQQQQTQETSTTTATMTTESSSTFATTYDSVPTLTTYPNNNRIVIVNNSEPFVMKEKYPSEQKYTTNPMNDAGETETNEYDGSQGTTTLLTTLPTTFIAEQTTAGTTTTSVNSETTTTEPLTTFKDQILEEGISAVTSILLDGEQKKEFLINMTKPFGFFNQSDETTLAHTTEEDGERNRETTVIVTTEISTTADTTASVTYSDEESEIRLDEIELTEKFDETTTADITSTTKQNEDVDSTEKSTTVADAEEVTLGNHNQVKKHVQSSNKNVVKVEAGNTTKNNSEISGADRIRNRTEQVVSEEKRVNNEADRDTVQVKQATAASTRKPLVKPSVQETNHTKPASQEIKKPTTITKPVNKKQPSQQPLKLDKIQNSTTTAKETVNKDAEGHNTTKMDTKNDEVTKKTTLNTGPIKESKLNPDIVDEPLQHVDAPQQNSTIQVTSSVIPPSNEENATTERSATVVHEPVKLQEADKSNPLINSKPNSKRPQQSPQIYQTAPQQELAAPPVAIELHPAPYESMGLEASTAFLAEDVRRFADLCNELAFKLWTAMTSKGQIASRSLVTSPFAVTSLLAMVFLGARGATSGQMNDILRLDDMVTFNPHQVLQNVTDSVLNSKNKGVATAAFVRQLYSDKAKGKLLDFYKERAQQYYQGHVEEINFSTIGDIIRRRTNLLIKRQTLGKVSEYLRGSSLSMRPPLAAFSANIFQTDCELGSTEGRDGEMYFVVRPSTRQRRLVPVPAVVWRKGFLAGYEPGLDATSVCLGADSTVSTILILPGQQGQVAPGDGLARLEQRLIETSYRRGAWSRLLRSQLPRPGLELQVPRFSHRSVLNVTGALTRMGLRDLFGSRADLRGLNGLSNDLHLSDMVQVNTFSTCGEETVGARHHIETYPASPQRTGRTDRFDYQSPGDQLHDYSYNAKQVQQQLSDFHLPMPLRSRQARLPDNPRLRFDRPFLYIVRHNPSGIILHMGRFNPRLLP